MLNLSDGRNRAFSIAVVKFKTLAWLPSRGAQTMPLFPQ